MFDYDFVILGGGSAGYAAARTAVAEGLRTAVVDGGSRLGGLCILRGCMPSKTLIESAHRYRVLRRAEEFGLRAGEIGFDAGEIIARKRRLIGEFADYRRSQLESGRFDLIRGAATFVDSETVCIAFPDGGTREVRARSFLIATGSVVAVPPVSGLAESGCWTSDDMLECESLPESLTVLGGGPVALELACYAANLGVRVTVIQRSAQVLSGADADVAEALAAGMREDGIEIFVGTKLLSIEKSAIGFTTTFEHEERSKRVESEQLLNALGRRASLDVIGASGVELAAGRVAATPDQRTSRNNIFAAGDVCGPLEVVHVAIQQGEIAARNAARLLGKRSDRDELIDYRLKLFAVFSEPQFATVGASESDLRVGSIKFASAKYPFADHGKSIVMGETVGFVKLLVDASSREILGASVVGPDAAELIHEIVVAMRFRATAGDLATTPHYHPTLSEIWTYPAEELACTEG